MANGIYGTEKINKYIEVDFNYFNIDHISGDHFSDVTWALGISNHRQLACLFNSLEYSWQKNVLSAFCLMPLNISKRTSILSPIE